MKFRYAAIAALISGLGCASAMAGEAEDKGLRIANEVDKRDVGYVDQEADARMVLRNKQGEESERVMRVRALEGPQDVSAGDRGLIIFDEPKDVAGTALLTHSFPKKQDDQWLYLPALKRVKRIASRNKSGPFMGSEFSYEDLSNQDVEKYTYRYLRDEACANGLTCFVVERFPRDKYSGYQRQVVWIDSAEYRVMKAEYYDRRNSLLKTLSTEGWNQYEGQFWRPDSMSMVNHQTGKSTLFEWNNFRFKSGFNERDFDKGALKRIR